MQLKGVAVPEAELGQLGLVGLLPSIQQSEHETVRHAVAHVPVVHGAWIHRERLLAMQAGGDQFVQHGEVGPHRAGPEGRDQVGGAFDLHQPVRLKRQAVLDDRVHRLAQRLPVHPFQDGALFGRQLHPVSLWRFRVPFAPSITPGQAQPVGIIAAAQRHDAHACCGAVIRTPARPTRTAPSPCRSTRASPCSRT